jgi:thioredoxin-like negative regulator of GroEL
MWDTIKAAEDSGQAPDLQVMQDLAEHLVAKNRKEEAAELLLESVAIDRNWNGRSAQNLLTDILK